MYKKKISFVAGTVFLGMLLAIPSAMAEQKSPEVLAESWVMVPKQGKAEGLEKALKKHSAHRAKLKDPRSWNLYSQVLGDQLDVVIARSFGFTWSDMDTYQDWSNEKNPTKHFDKHVQPNIKNIGHYMSVIDTANSHWGPEVEYRYVGVSSYKIKSGHQGALEKDIKLFSDVAKSNNWPYNWSWAQGVSGEASLSLAIPYKNWAEMAPPEQEFSALMAKHMGSEEKAAEVFERWQSHFDSVDYDIYVLRTDLMP